MINQKEQQLGETQFFAKANEEIRRICQESIKAQNIARKVKKINALKEQPKRKEIVASHYIKNLVIDFLRAHNLNYSYSVFMKQCDILSSQVISRQDLVQTFSLQAYYSSSPFNVSTIQLVLQKLAALDQQKIVKQYGAQIELLKSDNTANGVLLKEVQVASIRKEVEDSQKKHYQSMLAGMKKQLTTMLREDLKKQFDNKLKETRAEYERQVGVLKEKNKEFLINNPKINPKVEEYLNKISQLQAKNIALTNNFKELEKQKITHNCFKAPKIVAKQKQIDEIKSQLLKKKQEYQFALKTLNTSVNNLAGQNQRVIDSTKETDLFLEHIKNKKNTKDFMIDEMYGRMLVMDRRIETLTKENEGLKELNRQFTSKVSQLQELNDQLREKEALTFKTQEKLKIFNMKPSTKNIGINVTGEELKDAVKENKKQNVIDQIQSEISSSSDEDATIDKKTALRLQVNGLHSQLQLYKNKMRYFIQDFQ